MNKMENNTPEETIISSYAVILDETLDPLGVFLFHTNEEKDEGGNITQPAGWKLPGGGYEKLRDKTPRHTARNETLLEIGIKTGLAIYFRESRYGESLFETKRRINKEKILNLRVYTFFMERITGERKKNAESLEGGARGSFSLADILLMPLDRSKETGEMNPYGIHYSARRRIFITLKKAGYDFQKLILNLSELINKIDYEEVGTDVYWILKDALYAPKPESEETFLKKSIKIKHEKICHCDSCWKKWWAMAN